MSLKSILRSTNRSFRSGLIFPVISRGAAFSSFPRRSTSAMRVSSAESPEQPPPIPDDPLHVQGSVRIDDQARVKVRERRLPDRHGQGGRPHLDPFQEKRIPLQEILRRFFVPPREPR